MARERTQTTRTRTRAASKGNRARSTRAAASNPAQSTRERLIDAARELLHDGGYAAASVQAIADRVGLSVGALYRHFPSKAELFVDVFREAAKLDLAAMDRAAATGTSVERLEAAVVMHAKRALRSRRLAWALMYEPVDPVLDEERLVVRRKYCRHMAGLLRQGIAAGEIPEQNVELTAAALVGAISEALVGPLSPIAGQITGEREIVASLVRFCRRGVGAPDRPSLRLAMVQEDRE